MSGAEQSLPGIGPPSRGSKTRKRFLPTPNAMDAHITPSMVANEEKVERQLRRGDKDTSRRNTTGSLAKDILLGLTSSPEDSPVSPSPTPESDLPKTTSDGSGPSSHGSFAYYDLASSSWRTLQGSLLEEWATFSETWPRAGTTRNGIASRRQPSVPLTSVTGHSSWPTPHGMPKEGQPRNPGPSGNELGSGAAGYSTESGRHSGTTLTDAVVRFRSPQARDGDQRGPSSPDRRKEQGHSVSLHDQIGGSLNPTWVEWLMGFPLGRTDSVPSVTRSSRKSPNGSDDGS